MATPSLGRVLGNINLNNLGDPIAEIGLFAGASDPQEIEQRLREAVSEEVGSILSLTATFDAFDVVELMRLRELTISPELALQPGFDGSGAAVELVSLILLTRDGRKPHAMPLEDTRPHEAIEELHDRSKRLLRLATYRAKACEFLRGRDPLARLSASYQAYLVSVRALQYQSVQAKHERALFDRPEIDRILKEHLGYTHREFTAVRDAVQKRNSDIMTGLRDVTGELILTTRAEGREPTRDELESFQQSMVDFMFLPGRRAAFTVADIADCSGIDASVVGSVLDSVSLDFDPSRDATTVVVDFLHARNSLAQRGLMREHESHVVVSAPIGSDSLRTTIEAALKDTPAWKRYDATRRDVSESLAVAALERALGSSPFATNLKYYAPSKGAPTSVLDATCDAPATVGDLTESDALFVIDDVAFCLEVKGRSVAEQARRGDLARLQVEIKNILGSGAKQARRLESLIRDNGGLWLHDRTWLDLNHVREIRTIVAGLDDFGPLGVALGDLEVGPLVGDGPVPWITSIHDLEVISRVVDRPTEFLLYLRRRSDSGVATHFRGSDELDLFMLFMDGGLYVDDDPDDVHRLHPKTPSPTKADRARHQETAQPTLVGTFTDPLDAWMYWIEGSSHEQAGKPVFNLDPGMGELVDFLARGTKPGWLRTGADLLGLDGRVQGELVASIVQISKQTSADGQPHSLTQGFASATGFMTFFAGTVPAGADRQVEADRLVTYMLAKRHQVGSDRSFGLLVNHTGGIEMTIYLNDQPREDDELDALGSAMGLQRTWEKSKRRSSVSEKKRKRRAKRGR